MHLTLKPSKRKMLMNIYHKHVKIRKQQPYIGFIISVVQPKCYFQSLMCKENKRKQKRCKFLCFMSD